MNVKVLELADKIFIKRDMVQEYLHEKWNLSLTHFLTISPNLALLQLPSENLYMVPRVVNPPPPPPPPKKDPPLPSLPPIWWF